MTSPEIAIYWDSSAILAHLFGDVHGARASAYVQTTARHVVSSLAWAECAAAIARSQRSAALAAPNAELALRAISSSPWIAIADGPAPATLRALAVRYPLCGADLWHLALAVDLAEQIPELRLLTFDTVLSAAAHAEGLAVHEPA